MKKTFKKWLIPVIAAVVAVVAVVVLMATGVIGLDKTTEVPDILNMNVEDAQKILEENGLFICISERQINNELKENTVLKQSPESGAKVKEGTVIDVTVSIVSVETTIPDVEYYDKDLAIEVLQNEGFKVEVIEKETDEYADGIVISQSQTGKGQTGSVITITVSKNNKEESAETVSVPSITEKTLQEATEILGKKLYIRVVGEKFSDNVKKGAIIEQNPTAGNEVKENSVVEVVISKGKASEVQIIMPDVVYSSRTKAKATLEKLGLKVITKEMYDESTPAGIVSSQSIPAGKKVAAETEVTIVVSNGPKPEITTIRPEDLPTLSPSSTPSDTQKPADSEEAKYIADFAITTDKKEAKAGDIVTVSVKLKTNYKIVAISLPVIYDASIFEIVGGEDGNLASFLNFTGTLKENEYTTNGNWKSPDNMYSKNSNEAHWTSSLVKSRYKFAFATWVATPSSGTVISSLDNEETIVTFKLKVKENVSDTTGKIFLSQDFIKTADAPQGILSVGRSKSDTITADSIVATGQTFDLRDAVALVTIK